MNSLLKKASVVLAGLCFFAFLVVGVFFFLSSPVPFEGSRVVSVEEGETLRGIALSFKEEGVVRSATVLQSIVIAKGGEHSVVAGEYKFNEPTNAFEVAGRLARGERSRSAHEVTFPEGTSVREIGVILENSVGNISSKAFIDRAKRFEGYLFPDTYFFSRNVTTEEIITRMRENFEEQTSGVTPDPTLSEYSFKEIVIMASIVEEEATDEDARRIVAGILWQRLKDGIPLQVDAAFLYIPELYGKTTYTLTEDDLSIDSPYNTYTRVGLPPTPITNPGLEAIRAAAHPIYSEYRFYLSDTNSNMYYAKTYGEHVENLKFLGL